jgi:tRNA A-37 threonylcarbamoyl transferase component Bud32
MKENRFIASGAYGCIYHPPYDCKGKDLKDTSFVTKLVKNDYTSQTEYDVSNLLKGKDGFLLVQKKCSVSSKNIKKSMAKDCNLIEKKDPHIESKYLLLYSKFINGKELVDYMKDNFTINKMMKSFCFLCKQIETLIDCKIIHHDLHFGNIMYDYTENKFIVIDFGLSIIANKFYVNQELNTPYLKDAIFNYTPTWKYFAVEEHLLGYLIHEGNITEDVIKKTLDEYLNDHIIQKISPEYCNKYKEESFRYFKKFVNKPRDIIIKKFLSWWNTWDYYKISLHNIKMYIKLNIHFPELLMLLLLMIHPIPKYRPNVVEMNKNIQTLLNNDLPKIKYINQFDETLSNELSRPLSSI